MMKREYITWRNRVKATGLVLLILCVQVVCAGPEANYPSLRIATKGAGMFYVSASELAAVLGVDAIEVEGVLSAGLLKLENKGVEIARSIAVGGEGFYFYGEAIETAWTLKNAYFVTWAAGLNMSFAAGVAPAAVQGGTYRHTTHIEENLMPVTAVSTDPEKDFWIWHEYTAGNAAKGTNEYEIVLDAKGDGGNDPVLAIRLLGYSDTGVVDEHHANISVNGNPIADLYWTGRTEKTNSISFDSAHLTGDTNIITVVAVLESGVSYSQFYLDDIDITYDRKLEAISDQLLMPAVTGAVVTVTDMIGSNVYVADLSSPLTPMLLSGVTVEPSNSLYVASFVPSNSTVPYIVFEGSAGLLVDELALVSEVDLKSAEIDSEYVVITVPDLESASQKLADYRHGQRLNSRVVMLQDIYDQFNYGIEDPVVIRQFVQYAYSNWVYSLRYVVLGGSGSYDYKGAHPTAVDQLIPPMLISRAQGLTASDVGYGDVDGDWIPDVAVGRLPAVTAEGMTNLVDRIIAHEAATGSTWRQTIIMCADNPDNGGNFHVSSEDISGLVPGGYIQEKILMTNGGEAVASSDLKAAINSGALFMNYFGHSGPGTLADEVIFSIGDVPALTNTNQLPVVTSMSCVFGRFEFPAYDCLGEALMLGQSGGAIAIFAPSSLAMNRDSEMLCKEFYKKVFNDGVPVLGDAVKGALISYGQKNMNDELLKFYNLLGDPALYLSEVGVPTDDPFGAVVPELVTWKTNYYTEAQLTNIVVSGDFSDFDDDGLTAIVEYAFGRNPTVADNRSSIMAVKKSKVVLTEEYDVVLSFVRRKGMTGVAINVHATTDFSAWTENDANVVHTQVIDNGDGETETVKQYLKAPVDVDRLFITLSVEKVKL